MAHGNAEGHHHEGCVHSIQILNMNDKTFLKTQYVFKLQMTNNPSTQVYRAEELKAVQNRTWQERVKLDYQMAISKSYVNE
jgi:hypothetical protein